MISVEHISMSFGGIRAVQDCSLQIAKGSITGLIGPNGAGKTTLFNIIAGLYRPSAGRVLLDGCEVTGMKPHELFGRGLVRTFQIPQEFSNMPVIENLMLVPAGQAGESLLSACLAWGRVRGDEAKLRKRAEDVIDFLKLGAVRYERAGNLSGGQKKLLELGRVMMAEPKVVLLDEAGAGVNRTLMAELAADIERLNRERGYTFFVIEHDMDLIARLCDPVIVMAAGRVLTQGRMADIRKDERVIEAYFGGAARAEAA
jgi:branched-chain amino acid transport system ATP-binding protein